MAVFAGSPLSLKKGHCHWNKGFTGLGWLTVEKQGIQAASPSTAGLSPARCIQCWVVGDRGVLVAGVGSPPRPHSPLKPFPVPLQVALPLPQESHSAARLREEAREGQEDPGTHTPAWPESGRVTAWVPLGVAVGFVPAL